MRQIIPLLLASSLLGQTPLQQQIRSIAQESRGTVSVACALPGTPLNCDLHPLAHAPMQSVFKLPLAMLVLHQVEQGRLSLDQPVRFRREDRFIPRAYSPLQEEYPEAEVDVPLRTLLQMSVSLSDNVAADILLRLAGGPRAVGGYIASLGVEGFHIEDGEHAMHREPALQYRNWFAPRGAVELLRLLGDRSPLTQEDTALLLGWMRPAVPIKRLQADLPAGVSVAHKSGTSDVVVGVAAATNDVGLISMPGGPQLAIAVFVSDARADEDTRERVIARIARAAYDAALSGTPPEQRRRP